MTLGLARLPVAALQFLLRVVEALLDGGDGAQVAPDGEHRAALAQPQRGVGDGDVAAAVAAVVDLAPARQPRAGGVVQQQFDLAPGLAGDGIGPVSADPAFGRGRHRGAGALRHTRDDAAVIDHQRNVAGKGDEHLGQLCGAPGKGAQVGRLMCSAVHGDPSVLGAEAGRSVSTPDDCRSVPGETPGFPARPRGSVCYTRAMPSRCATSLKKMRTCAIGFLRTSSLFM